MSEDEDLYMSDPAAKTVKGMIVALGILARHMKNGEDSAHFTAAEHDVFYVSTGVDAEYQTQPRPDTDDGRRLIALGWHFEEDTDGWAYFT